MVQISVSSYLLLDLQAFHSFTFYAYLAIKYICINTLFFILLKLTQIKEHISDKAGNLKPCKLINE